MYRLRLPLLLGLALAVGATPLAKGQDDLDRYKSQDPDSKHDKAKNKKQAKIKNDDGRRKHWYSLPHFRHKKHDNDSDARRTATTPSSKNAAAKPVAAKSMNKAGAPGNPPKKTAAATKPVAKSGQGASKKPLRHNCSPEEAKKGNCQPDKGHSAKATTKAS